MQIIASKRKLVELQLLHEIDIQVSELVDGFHIIVVYVPYVMIVNRIKNNNSLSSYFGNISTFFNYTSFSYSRTHNPFTNNKFSFFMR
jgi:ribosome-interacting GTPase 1